MDVSGLDAPARRNLLKAAFEEARGCTRCPLHETRTQVVFGAGNADADLMFVGEAPGANEDRLGLPFVGQAGKLLEKLLGEIGLAREDVFIANTLKCRPPGNRDPHPNEIEACHDYLRRQVAVIQPTVICTLGNFATKLLRGDQTGISRLHGRDEERTIGARTVRLLPLFHPAAGLYTPSMLETLRADFGRIPELLAQGAPAQPVPVFAAAGGSPPPVQPPELGAIEAREVGPAEVGAIEAREVESGELARIEDAESLADAAASPEPESLLQLGLF